jgi:hypothetical protein
MYRRSNLFKLLFVAVVMLVLVGCGQVVRAAQGTMEMVAALRAHRYPFTYLDPYAHCYAIGRSYHGDAIR